MARIIPIIIQVQGGQQLADVGTQIKNAFKDIHQGADDASGGMRSAFLQADLVGRVVSNAFSMAKSEIADAAREALEFSRNIANINTLLDDNSIGGYRQGLIDLDPALGHTSELARGMYQAISSGVDAKDALDFITVSAKAARAGLASTFETVDAGTSVMASFGLQAKDATSIYDKMFEVVKRGKIEMPQLASSIGMVSGIAATAGVNIDEMFAAIATSSRTLQPDSAITGFRAALEAIIKPAPQAIALARSLGVEFDSQSLKAKGFAKFLQDVAIATGGDIEKMSTLFPEVRGLAFVMSTTGNSAKSFAEDLKGIAGASGTVEAAFEKQANTVSAQWDILKVSFEKKLLTVFTALEPALIGSLKAIGFLQPALLTLTPVVLGLAAAYALYNAQLLVAGVARIGALIGGIQSVIFWMVNWKVAMLELTEVGIASQAGMAALTGYLGLAVAAIGVLVYAWYSYEGAADKANKITIEQINSQIKAAEQSKDLAAQAAAVGAAQEGSAERHEKLNAVIAELNPNTQVYINALTTEKDKIAALTSEIDKNVAANKTRMEISLRVVGAGIIQEQNELAALKMAQANINAQIQNSFDAAKSGGPSPKLEALDAQYLELQKQIDGLNQKLAENVLKLGADAKALDLAGGSLGQFFATAGRTKEETSRLTSVYDLLTSAAQKTADAHDKNAQALAHQAEAIREVKTALEGLLKTGELEIDKKVLDIAGRARNAAEAKRFAQEALRGDDSFRKLVEDRKRYTEVEKAARGVFEPSVRDTTTKAPSDSLVSSLVKTNLGLGPVTPKDPKLARMIATYAETFGIPLWVAFAQIYTESGGYKQSVIEGRQLSPAGAIGMTQVMPGTAAQYGISTASLKNPEGALSAYGRIMGDLYKRYGDWQLAILAYHQGPGTVDKLQSMLERHARGEITDAQAEKQYRQIIGPKGRAYVGAIDIYKDSGGRSTGDNAFDAASVSRAAANLTPERAKALTAKMIARLQQSPITSEDTTAQLKLSPDVQRTWDIFYEDMFQREDALRDRRRFARDEYYASYKNMLTEIGNLDLDLAQMRRQNADDQFTEQRRLLLQKSEEVDLNKQLQKVQDEIATGPYNEGLRLQLAYEQAILGVQHEREDALVRNIQNQVKLAHQMDLDTSRLNDGVVDFLAQQKTLQQTFQDVRTNTVRSFFDGIDSAIDKATKKAGMFSGVLNQLLKDLSHLFASQLLQRLLGLGTSGSQVSGVGGQASGSGGIGGGIFGTLGGVIKNFLNPATGAGGGGGASITGGGLFNPITGESISVPPAVAGQGGILGSLQGLFGGGGGAAGAGGLASMGASLATLGPIAAGVIALQTTISAFRGETSGLQAFMGGGLLALFVGTWKRRQKEEKIRDAASGNTLTDLYTILFKAQAGNETLAQAKGDFEQVHQQYLQSIAGVKEAKTRRNALLWWDYVAGTKVDPGRPPNHTDAIWPLIEAAAKKGEAAGAFKQAFIPTFDRGIDKGVVPDFGHAMSLIKVRPGERIDDVGLRASWIVPGIDTGRDSVYTVATPKSAVRTRQQQRIPGFAEGFSGPSVAGGDGAGAAPIIIQQSFSIDVEGMVTQKLKSPTGRKIIVETVASDIDKRGETYQTIRRKDSSRLS